MDTLKCGTLVRIDNNIPRLRGKPNTGRVIQIVLGRRPDARVQRYIVAVGGEILYLDKDAEFAVIERPEECAIVGLGSRVVLRGAFETHQLNEFRERFLQGTVVETLYDDDEDVFWFKVKFDNDGGSFFFQAEELVQVRSQVVEARAERLYNIWASSGAIGDTPFFRLSETARALWRRIALTD